MPRDKHTLKAGFDIRRRHMGEFQTNRGNGRFNFSPNITNNPANNTGGHAMASFLLGAPSLIEQDYLLVDVAIRWTEYGLYVADDWRADSTLTLNLGTALRARYAATETSDAWANFDPTTATVLVAGRNGVSETAGVKTFKKMFAPRLGFAYRLAQHTVVRGGAGIFWNTPGTAATPCACTGTCRSDRSTASILAISSSAGASATAFQRFRMLDLSLADNPSGSVIGVDPELSARVRRAVQSDASNTSLPRSLLLKTSYVGNIGRHLDTTYNLNQAVPGPGAVNNRRPFFAVRPTLADVTWAVSDGMASYHALQFSAEKRLVARIERLAFVHVGPFHRHGGSKLRRRRRRTVATGSTQSRRRPRQLAIRHAPSTDDRLELRCFRSAKGGGG